MRISLLILLIFLSSNCSNNKKFNKLIREIDDIEPIVKSYEVELDSSNQILDTIEFKLFKEDENQNLVYEEYPIEINMKSYYLNNELIYRTSQYDGFNSEVMASFDTESRIVKMTSTEIEEGKSKTLVIDYKYNKNSSGQIESKDIYESSNGIKKIGTVHFNDNDNKVKEIFFDESDTTNLNTFNYEKGKLTSSTKWYKFNTEYVYEFLYNEDENVIQEKTYKNDELVYTADYQYISKNRAMTKESKNLETGQKRYFKFIYE